MDKMIIKKIGMIALAFALVFTAVSVTSYTADAKITKKTVQKKTSSKNKSKRKSGKKKNTARTYTLKQPETVSSESITFSDHFISDSENKLTISWPGSENATSYEITSQITGTTDDESVLTKVENADRTTVYTGKSAHASVTVPRKYSLPFRDQEHCI